MDVAIFTRKREQGANGSSGAAAPGISSRLAGRLSDTRERVVEMRGGDRGGRPPRGERGERGERRERSDRDRDSEARLAELERRERELQRRERELALRESGQA